MSPDLDLLSLSLFVDTLRLGSLSKAAAHHHLGQPSASLRLRTLERQLGVRLLDRSPTGSVPTPVGRLVEEWAADVLAAIDRMRIGVDAVKAGPRRALRIASSYSIAEHLLPRWLASLRSGGSGGVKLDVVNSTAVLAALATGTADIGFVECPTLPPGVASQVVARDHLVIVVPRSHPWADHELVTLQMLGEERLVLREEGSGTRQAFDLALRATGSTVEPPALELGSTAAILGAVRGGAGPGVVSSLAVGDHSWGDSLVARRVDDADLARELRAVWPAGRILDPGASRLLALASGL